MPIPTSNQEIVLIVDDDATIPRTSSDQAFKGRVCVSGRCREFGSYGCYSKQARRLDAARYHPAR